MECMAALVALSPEGRAVSEISREAATLLFRGEQAVRERGHTATFVSHALPRILLELNIKSPEARAGFLEDCIRDAEVRRVTLLDSLESRADEVKLLATLSHSVKGIRFVLKPDLLLETLNSRELKNDPAKTREFLRTISQRVIDGVAVGEISPSDGRAIADNLRQFGAGLPNHTKREARLYQLVQEWSNRISNFVSHGS